MTYKIILPPPPHPSPLTPPPSPIQSHYICIITTFPSLMTPVVQEICKNDQFTNSQLATKRSTRVKSNTEFDQCHQNNIWIILLSRKSITKYRLLHSLIIYIDIPRKQFLIQERKNLTIIFVKHFYIKCFNLGEIHNSFISDCQSKSHINDGIDSP